MAQHNAINTTTPLLQQEWVSPAVSTPYEEEVMLLTTVDIAPGYSKVIKMRRADNALDVAKQFCRANGLPDAVIGALEAHLTSHLKQASVSFPCSRCTRHTPL